MGLPEAVAIALLVDALEQSQAVAQPVTYSTRLQRVSGEGPVLELAGPGVLDELHVSGPCDYMVELVVDGYLSIQSRVSQLHSVSKYLEVVSAYRGESGEWHLVLRGIHYASRLQLRVSGCPVEGAARWREVAQGEPG